MHVSIRKQKARICRALFAKFETQRAIAQNEIQTKRLASQIERERERDRERKCMFVCIFDRLDVAGEKRLKENRKIVLAHSRVCRCEWYLCADPCSRGVSRAAQCISPLVYVDCSISIV